MWVYDENEHKRKKGKEGVVALHWRLPVKLWRNDAGAWRWLWALLLLPWLRAVHVQQTHVTLHPHISCMGEGILSPETRTQPQLPWKDFLFQRPSWKSNPESAVPFLHFLVYGGGKGRPGCILFSFAFGDLSGFHLILSRAGAI